MFFTNYNRRPFQELSINGQKVESEEDPADTNYEDDEGTTPAETPPAEAPAAEEPPATEPAAEPAPEGDAAPATDEPPAEGEEETPDYDIPDDAEPASEPAPEGGEDATPDYSEEGNADEGGEEPPAEGDTGDNETPNYDEEGDDAGGGEATPDYEGGGDDETPNYDDNDGEVSSDGEDAETSDGTIGDEGGEEGASGSQLMNDLKSMEDEIFADLSPEQKDIRDNELKQRYIDLYSVIDDAERRINNIIKSEATAEILEFITRKMNELKNLIHHNLTKVYDTRTYTENEAALQECIAMMNVICQMLDKIAEDETPPEDDNAKDPYEGPI